MCLETPIFHWKEMMLKYRKMLKHNFMTANVSDMMEYVFGGVHAYMEVLDEFEESLFKSPKMRGKLYMFEVAVMI